MRNILFVLAAMLTGLLIASLASAQSIEAGVKGGFNAATVSGLTEGVPLENLTPGARGGGIGGGFVAIRVRDGLWIQPEVLLSAKGATVDGAGTGTTERSYAARLRYLEMPLLLRVETPSRRIFATAGPMLAFNVGASYRSQIGSRVSVEDVDAEVKAHDAGLVLGAGTRIARVLVEGRWTQGLRDVGEAGAFAKPVKTRTLSILAGVAF